MIVYVVVTGEYGEGYRIVAAYETRAEAEECATRHAPRLSCDYTEILEMPLGVEMAE